MFKLETNRIYFTVIICQVLNQNYYILTIHTEFMRTNQKNYRGTGLRNIIYENIPKYVRNVIQWSCKDKLGHFDYMVF